jgi:predicted dehydrogenase
MVRIGIVGAGDMGRTHARYYSRMKNVEIAGIVARTETRARKLADELNAPWIPDYQKLLDDETVDAIDICNPSGLHKEYVVEALNQGKHVFCETPIALTIADADAMVSAAKTASRILMVAQVMRLVGASAFVRNEVVSGRLGRPFVAYAGRFSPRFWSKENPRSFDVYGNVVVEMMIHDFDFLNWMLGMPRQISGTGFVGSSGSFEHVFVSLQYEEAIALVEGGAMMPNSFPFSTSLRVVCDEGALDLDFHVSSEEGFKTTLMKYPFSGKTERPEFADVDPYEEECKHFVNCVEDRVESSLLEADAAIDGLKVALAAQEALEKGKEVDFDRFR